MTTDAYSKAIKQLESAEKSARAAFDALQAAEDRRAGAEIHRLSRAAEEAERALQEALDAAWREWRNHWSDRLNTLRQEIASNLFPAVREYNAVSLILGDKVVNPAFRVLENLLIANPARIELLDEGVPADSPDCALLEERRVDLRFYF